MSCLAVASHHEHYDHPSYYAASSGRYYDTIEISEGSASPVHHTRHAQRKSEGAISIAQLQRSLSNAGLVNVNKNIASDSAASPADSQKKDGKNDNSKQHQHQNWVNYKDKKNRLSVRISSG